MAIVESVTQNENTGTQHADRDPLHTKLAYTPPWDESVLPHQRSITTETQYVFAVGALANRARTIPK